MNTPKEVYCIETRQLRKQELPDSCFLSKKSIERLLRSILKTLKKQQVVWQKWTREGVFEQ